MSKKTPIIPYLAQSTRWFMDNLFELIWPARCVGCEKLGVLLCEDCQSALPYIDPEQACPRCGAPFGKLVCTECTTVYETQPKEMPFSQACCSLEFTDLSRRIIVAYKDGGEQRLAPLLARLAAQAIPQEWYTWADVLTWIPADADAVRRRGFDHIALVAVSLAQISAMPLQPLLSKGVHEDQRALNREARKQNMRRVFSLYEGAQERIGTLIKKVILVDDVFTTGATLSAATEVLLEAGVEEARVVTVYRVW